MSFPHGCVSGSPTTSAHVPTSWCPSLGRNTMGKINKRKLRDSYLAGAIESA